MSDEGDGGVFRRDAKMIADLRSFREMLAYRAPGKEEMTVTLEELDALLRAVDTRDALNAASCEMPDERPSNVTPIGREAKILGEFVTMRVDEWRRVTDELSRLRTDEATRLDARVEEDDRVIAWDQIAAHTFFRECYGTKGSLLDAMLAKLTASTFEAPIPDEIRKRAGSTALGIPYERPRLRDVVGDALGEVGCGSCYGSMSTQVEAVSLAIEKAIAEGGIS